MKKLGILTVAVIIASLSLAIPLIGCQGEISFTTASLSEATMCLSVDDEERPVDATDVFSTDTLEIYTSAKLSNAPPDTEIKVEWIYIEGEVEVSDYLIDTFVDTTEGSGYPWVAIVSSDGGWPRGKYKAVWYIDGKEKVSLTFTVR